MSEAVSITYVEGPSVAEILKAAPPAKRAALLRAAEVEILDLLETTHLSVGLPKCDGKWNSQLCLSLEAVRQRILPLAKRKNSPISA